MRSEIRNTNGSVVLLLGAGVSIEAGVPHTAKMIKDINNLLGEEKGEWSVYRPIYNHLKKLYGPVRKIEDGLTIHDDLNIEELVSTLDELLALLEGKHTLYPFFKDWVDLFQNLYGFTDIKNFRDKIENKLKEWIVPDVMELSYFRYLLLFAKENPGSGLRVFTLNYDRCVEESFQEYNDIAGIRLERGFGEEKQNCVWNARNFEEKSDFDQPSDVEKDKHLFLYKMHGSIDWGRTTKQELTKINGQNISELIFGVRQKVQAHDPYLYYVYQFRTYTLNAKLIIVCGYSFFDAHINDILHQSLQNNPSQKILICHYQSHEEMDIIVTQSEEQLLEKRTRIADNYIIKGKLGLNEKDQVIIEFGTAKTFFEKCLHLDFVEKYFPEDEVEKLFFDTTSTE